MEVGNHKNLLGLLKCRGMFSGVKTLIPLLPALGGCAGPMVFAPDRRLYLPWGYTRLPFPLFFQ